MANNKIKIVGYAQKTVYDGSIEYRNFTPDLVGFQLASDGGTPLFTMGNFAITTNMDNKIDKFNNTSKFSNFLTLTDLNVTLEETITLLNDNAEVILNLDKSKLDYYALFGSLSEFIRVSLEDIIIRWPASLYITPVSQDSNGETLNGFTVENYSYDSIQNVASFKINTTFILNKFNLVYTENGSVLNTFNETNDLRNVTTNYLSYSVLYNSVEYPLIAFTASTYDTNDYIYLSVVGDPFSGTTTDLNVYYHIKPNKIEEDKFFNSLPDLEAYLLNRRVTPLYTASFKYPIKSDTGVILYITDTITWPVSDGYNIDYDTVAYGDYANKLLQIATSNDSISSNLMNRFLVSESITSFDTTPINFTDYEDDTGQKVNKTLQIYGREYDEINKYITGIKFANTVTYDREDNTPDVYLKNVAKVLGWDLISSVIDNDLLSNYISNATSTYSGETVGMTPVEADIELWRRLILNTPWLWKSKGTRKSVEFLLRFIGTPQGLITFNEYVYKANAPIDIDKFVEILRLNGLSTDLNNYPIDSNGYPRPFDDTNDMYFQNDGLWYRETGGTGSTIDILTGNNPHVGAYDGGNKYINQFKHLIPDFTPVTLSSETINTTTSNLYINYDLGSFDEGVTTATTVNTVECVSEDNVDISECIVFTPTIELDPNPSVVYNDCGCETNDSDNVLSLCVEKNTRIPEPCSASLFGTPTSDVNTGWYQFQYYQYNMDGSIYTIGVNPVLNTSNYTAKECCKKIGGTPYIYNEVSNGVIKNTGYVCCDNSGKCGCTIACSWMVQLQTIQLPLLTPTYNGPQKQYLQFTKPDNMISIVTPDGCNCIPKYSIPIQNITDPNTGEVGVACQLTKSGESDILLGTNSEIYQYYLDRTTGVSSCYPK